MLVLNNVFKWSFYVAAISAMIVLGSIFGVWFFIEALAFLIRTGV